MIRIGEDASPRRQRRLTMLVAWALVAGSITVATTAYPSNARAATTARLWPAGTTWSALGAAVRRIPGYSRHAPAKWRVSTKYPHWGVTDWYNNTVYISPAVPVQYLDAVVRHEWSHILEARDYGLDIPKAEAALNRHFGGPGTTGMRGAEYAADCMALELGANWTYYTGCRTPSWRRAAWRLLHGLRLR